MRVQHKRRFAEVLFLFIFLILLEAQPLWAETLPLPREGEPWLYAQDLSFQPDDELNLRCLGQSYPEIQGLERRSDGLWLVLVGGLRVLYAGERVGRDYYDVDVRTSMAQPYVCEPERPETPAGYAPGRRRSYDLLHALYGHNAASVARSLQHVRALGQNWTFAPKAAEAFRRAAMVLEGKVAVHPELRPWLKSSGTFSWRRIAGQTVLSAHSFGIAFDIGVGRGATYWRWSALTRHPLQQTFSPDIVRAFEDEGFIWGGKWHEFDLMHFEYRPELICKAKRRHSQQTPRPASVPQARW